MSQREDANGAKTPRSRQSLGVKYSCDAKNRFFVHFRRQNSSEQTQRDRHTRAWKAPAAQHPLPACRATPPFALRPAWTHHKGLKGDWTAPVKTLQIWNAQRPDRFLLTSMFLRQKKLIKSFEVISLWLEQCRSLCYSRKRFWEILSFLLLSLSLCR